MIIKIFIITILILPTAFSQEFSGCGEYVLKGVLRLDDQVPFKIKYVVNENTKSQMIFTFLQMEDVNKVALMVNLPTKINANITKAMDGTRGVLTFPSEVERRLPNPLSSKDTGIIKVKNFKCN